MKRNTQRLITAVAAVMMMWMMDGCGTANRVDVRILHTSDVHGNVFPTNMIRCQDGRGGLSRLASALKEIRPQAKHLLLIDGGDILQGQPAAYYYNYVDTTDMHVMTRAMNYLKYDVATMGNHDLETGHGVYDKFVRECNFPVLAANAIDDKTGKSYFCPYQIFEREGVRIAVLGLITPAIPEWLPKTLYEGMHFEDIIESADKWVQELHQKEKPDLMVALIHSGVDNNNPRYLENAGRELARRVSGIDMVLCGHDHRQYNLWEKNPQGDSVLVIDPANAANVVSDIHVTFHRKGHQVVGKEIKADLLNLNYYQPDADFVKAFAPYQERVAAFLYKKVGTMDAAVKATDALFGSSAYMDVIHRSQLATVEADISLAAPLILSAKLPEGELYVRDLFQFFPFSNMLYLMDLTGEEVRAYLEYSYAQWAGEMKNADDHLLRFVPDAKSSDKYKTVTPTYNYSSAQGINYTVDLRLPVGQRVYINGMSDGRPFDPKAHYRVAVNSYRAGGAGGHLTEGAGISIDELPKRILKITYFDQLFSLMRWIEQYPEVTPRNPDNWCFLPDEWVAFAKKRDLEFLFSH